MMKTLTKIAFVSILIIFKGLNAQAPWCDGYHYYQNSSLGGYSPSNYVIAIEQIRIREDSSIIYNHAADGYSGGVSCGQEYRLSNSGSKAFPLITGHTYTIDASSSSAYSYHANFGLFIDLNGDRDFLDAGEYMGAWSDVNNGRFKASLLKSKDFIIPCSAKLGATRMRIVCNYNVYTMNASYGCTSCSGPPYYGETLDISIIIDKPNSLSADFLVPNSIWIKTVRQFVNKNQAGYLSHDWDINTDGLYDQTGSTPNFKTKPSTWTTPGTKCMKLRSVNCLGKDSTVKCFQVSAPNSVPVADFIASSSSISQYEVVKVHDLSDFGPWKWTWEVYDSTTYASIGYYPSLASGEVIADPSNIGLNEFSSTPEFQFDVPGCYTIVLTSTNDVGPSAPRAKSCYVKVSLPTNYNLGFGTYGSRGDNYVESPTGTISDNGGPWSDYGLDQGMGSRSFLCITPCNAKKIKLHLSQIKFKDAKDILSVWDGNSPGGANSTLLAVYNHLSKGPKDIVATKGSMFILFESDDQGVDSGFYGHYTSDLAPAQLPQPYFDDDVNAIFNSRPITFFNLTPDLVGLPDWEWTVDGASISHKKDLNYTFTNNGQHQVCLKMSSCAGKNQICSTVNVTQANTQSDLDFIVSKNKIESDEIVEVKFFSEVANRFELTISPSTFTLLNPPSSPSIYDKSGGKIRYLAMPGDTFPIPRIKFDAPGCYQFTLTGHNSTDQTNTSKTLVKKDFVCVIEYCSPNSYIQTTGIGINSVRLFDTTNAILEKKSSSGKLGYNNYLDSNAASLVNCKTYEIEIGRNSFVDSVNIGAYIDWNIDGDFDDQYENILLINNYQKGVIRTSFTVPEMNIAPLGKTRLRVATGYKNQGISPCGPLQVGEYEDYTLWIEREQMAPEIKLLGPDTLIFQEGSTFVDPGATAIDNVEGDISYKIRVESNINMSVIGWYEILYKVCDCAQNCIQVSRPVLVVSNIPPPVIQLNPTSPGCIEARRNNPPYVDPGAIAYAFNPLVSLTNNIIVTGYVNPRQVGRYRLTYKVTDIRNVTTTVHRDVCVEDREPPLIITPMDTNIQLGSIWIDPSTVEDDYDMRPELNVRWIPNQPLNSYDKKIYTAIYTAHDSSGNQADTVIVHYRVDDFIPPVITLNTESKVYHEVRTLYNSTPVHVTDNYYDQDKTVVRLIFSDVDEFTIGTYHEIFEAIDGSGNVSRKTRTVEVIDQTPPRIWGNSLKGCVGENIWPLWGLYVLDNYNTQSQLKPLIEILNQNVNIWDEGVYQITYRVTDLSGNSSEPFVRWVEIRYPPNCKNSSSDINHTDSIASLFDVYPNPNSGTFDIMLKNYGNQTSNHFQIIDCTGRIVYEQLLSSNHQKLELDELPSGLYTIMVSREGLLQRKTICIQK